MGRLAGVPAPVGRQAFDQIAEYILQYGEHVLRNLDDLDDDDMPDILELIQKEGLIEKDGEGKWRVTPKGLRRIQDNALTDLFQTFQRDALGRHDTPQKGGGTVRLEDSKPYVYGDSLANLNLHETLKNAYVRQGGGVPIRLQQDDYVVHETEYQTRCATVVLIDMSGSMGRYGKYYTTKKVALALQAMVRGAVPAGHAADGRLLHLRQRDDRAAAAQLGPEAGRASTTAGSTCGSTSTTRPRACRSTSPTSTPACGWPASILGRSGAANKQIIVHHRRRADGAHRGARGRPDLSARRRRPPRHTLAEAKQLRRRRASACRASP